MQGLKPSRRPSTRKPRRRSRRLATAGPAVGRSSRTSKVTGLGRKPKTAKRRLSISQAIRGGQTVPPARPRRAPLPPARRGRPRRRRYLPAHRGEPRIWKSFERDAREKKPMIERYRGGPVFRGSQRKARYTPSKNPMYRHNAFIEALPPVMETTEVMERIARSPVYDKSERLLSDTDRLEA